MLSSLKKSFFNHSPLWIKDVVVSIYGFKLLKQRYGSVYRKEFSRLIDKDFSSTQGEQNTQLSSLRFFLKKSIAQSPFYANLYKGIDIDAIQSVADMKRFPIVKKEDLRANLDTIYTLKEQEAIVSFTGGTTGKSLKVLFTPSDMQRRMAYLDFFKHKAGVTNLKRARKATFSGRELLKITESRRFWLYNRAYNQRLYSTFHLKEKHLPEYIKDLNKFKPEIINGFVSALYEVATYIERKGIVLSFKPKAMFTTSETLLPEHRFLIECVFQSKIYDQYASAEGAPFITECSNGNLHYNTDTGVIWQNEVDDQGSGNMIITSFTTSGTPLINYDIGDRITFKKGSCSCGVAHPLVASIEGRKVDFLYALDKSKVSLSHLADVIKGTPNSIIKMQFIQEVLGTLKVLTVVDQKLFIEDDYTKLERSLRYRFGRDMEIVFEIVQDIPREKSGKYRLIKNQIQSEI